jgi:DNA modification methylase
MESTMNELSPKPPRNAIKKPLGLKIETVKISSIKPADKNANIHPDEQIELIERSMARFGPVNPPLIDENNRIINGHGRVEGARKAGMETIEVIRVSHLSDKEKKALAIVDNRISELSYFDFGILREHFEELEADPEISLDMSLLGFSDAEVDEIMSINDDAAQEPEEERLPVIDRSETVTRPKDVFEIGNHRLGCGDIRDKACVARVMQDEKADCVFTDPPYNVAIPGNVCGSGGIHHPEFLMASGEMSPQEFQTFLTDSLEMLAWFSRDGSIHFVCMDWRHLLELYSAARQVYDEQKNLISWVKTNAGMGTFYRSQHEPIGVYKKGKGRHVNNFGLGENGRYRTNVWTYPGVNSFGPQQADLALHPTVKPTALVADALRDVTRRGDIVLDGFAGSGTTLLAAEKTHRRARLIELDPWYCDIICLRAKNVLGLDARLLETGETFDEVKRRRSSNQV